MFLVDAQLPPALARWIAQRGHPADHVGGVMGDPSATDAAIWSRAARPGWVLVSKDQDVADRALVLGPPPVVIDLTLGNRSTRDLLSHMERCWEPIVALVQDPEVSLITVER